MENAKSQMTADSEKDQRSFRPRPADALPFLNVVRDASGQSIEMNRYDEYGIDELRAALGETDPRIICGLLSQIVNLNNRSTWCDEEAINFTVALVRNNNPRNALQVMLVINMATTQSHLIDVSRKLTNATDPIEQEIYQRMFLKFANLFSSQAETYKRLQQDGERQPLVHNTIETRIAVVDNGAAENCSHRTRQSRKSSTALTYERAEPMPIIDSPERRTSNAKVKVGSKKAK